MDTKNNKSAILVIIALIVMCIGSFVGMNAILGKDDVPPPAKTTLPPTTQAAPTTDNSATSATDPTVSTGDLPAIIVTDPSSVTDPSGSTNPTDPTTPSGEGTTEPSTDGTTQPSTEDTTKPSTQPTTGSQPSSGGENGAIFDDGLGGYQYDPDGNFYYTSSDPWQRYGGYNELYDLGAPFVGIFMDTMRLRFEYGGKDWMIQFWKGQYGYLFVGHEIGVYTKPKDRDVDHYDAASNEEALFMSMTGYRKGEEIYSREYGKYWWCTGFVPGRLDSMTDRSELSLSCRITAKDYAMLLAICGALKENGYELGENFTTQGLDVYITW